MSVRLRRSAEGAELRERMLKMPSGLFEVSDRPGRRGAYAELSTAVLSPSLDRPCRSSSRGWTVSAILIVVILSDTGEKDSAGTKVSHLQVNIQAGWNNPLYDTSWLMCFHHVKEICEVGIPGSLPCMAVRANYSM